MALSKKIKTKLFRTSLLGVLVLCVAVSGSMLLINVAPISAQGSGAFSVPDEKIKDKATSYCAEAHKGSDDGAKTDREQCRKEYTKSVTEACKSQRTTAARYGECTDGQFVKTEKELKGEDTNGPESPGCDLSLSSPLSWIICPLVEAGTTFTDFVFNNLVEPLLSNNPIDSDSSSGTYKAWQGFRLIANIILVVALLVIVFAQSFGRGGSVLSAYAVKKMAPRILLAVIAINLSIYLVVATVDITNIVGKGLGQLLREPFIDAGTFDGKTLQANAESTIAGGGIVGIVGAGFLGIVVPAIISAGAVASIVAVAGGLGLLLLLLIMLVGAAALAVVATVVIRYGLVVFLGLIAPIAIACFILPSTEKYFRSWWSLFSKTLLVYPIIAIIFAMSDIMASIFLNLQSNDSVNDIAGLSGVVIAVFAVYAPLFLIPFAFKFAGGVVGGIYDFSKKGADRFDNAIFGDEKDPDSLRGRSKLKLRSNMASSDLSAKALSARANPFNYGSQARKERRTGDLAAIRTAYAGKYGAEAAQSIFAKAGEQTDEVQMDLASYRDSAESRAAILNGTHKGYSDTQRSIMQKIANGEYVSDKERTELETRQSQLRMYSAMSDRVGRTQATRSAAANSGAALSYGYQNGEAGWNEAVEVAKSIYGEDNEAEILNHMNKFQYVAKQVGRADLSGNVNSTEYNGDRAFKSVTLQQHGAGKPHSIKGSQAWYEQSVKDAVSGIDHRTGKVIADKEREKMLVDAAVFTNELSEIGRYASGGTRDAAIEAQRKMKALDIAGRKYDSEDAGNILSALNGGTVIPSEEQAVKLKANITDRSRVWDPTTARTAGEEGAPGGPDPNQGGQT